MKSVALYSNKGGVGKTAAAVNLAYLASRTELKTLICDLDPQASTTFYFRVKPKLKPGAKGLTKAGKSLDKSIKGSDYDHLDLLPADFSHRNLDIVFNKLTHSKRQLDKVISPFKTDYDLLVFDCPPTINLVAENIFTTADIILVPLIPTPLSVRTYKQLLLFFKKKGYALNKIYAFFSMVDRRKKLHREFMESMQNGSSSTGLCQAIIPYASDVEKMGLIREPVNAFAPRSRAAISYQVLWDEVQQILGLF